MPQSSTPPPPPVAPAASGGNASASAVASSSTGAPLPSGAPTSSERFGPPSVGLQSDTVVFQAAKIPMSSARLASAPGAAASAPRQQPSRDVGHYSYRRDPSDDCGYAEDYRDNGAVARDWPRAARQMLPPARAPAGRYHGPPSVAAMPRSHGHQNMDHPNDVNTPPPPHTNGTALPAGVAGSRPSSAPRPQPGRAPRVRRLTVRVRKEGDKLGFGIRNDGTRQLKVSTLQSNSAAANSSLRIGDTLLAVNGVDLTNMGFLEVIQQLKATKPGDLVFDIERSLDGDGETPNGSETTDLDAPLEPQSSGNDNAISAQQPPLSSQSVPGLSALPPRQPTEMPMEPAAETRGLRPDARAYSPSLTEPRIVGVEPSQRMEVPPSEPPRKRVRAVGVPTGSLEGELIRMEKQHKAVLNALSMELKKEKTERLSLEDKNAALRRRLQKMLIECDDVRVKASAAVASIKDKSRRDMEELKVALQTARAQLRLQDRGPDVARTDSIISDLNMARLQLDRLKRIDVERSNLLTSRYSMESRLADREARRVLKQLIVMMCQQLRDASRRHFSHGGPPPRPIGPDGKHDPSTIIVTEFEGLRRLAFVKIFGLPCSFEWYVSDDFHSPAPLRHVLRHPEEMMDVFGNSLAHEERAGLFIVAAAPMHVEYDPTIERLTMSFPWAEQNQIRELARNFRF
ncbi:hypothetical protein P43SY_010070 [Pythium insidiosum]|uniref:PDZ domain-containing protein n=1 Tax=Pythium insidiosum TaxID=114742 RepID=A0AAD5Q860_PYTIN|nr:hypothetical protein P43SY_010070 [Pythium insidiosum]